METLIYSIFIFAVYLQVSDSAYSCDQSIPTIAYVTSCPTDKNEWDIAAKRKNCESLAKIQTCTDEKSFQYHCLENQWQNMTLEICAPIFFLQGYCAKYNTEKKRVEENYAPGFECLRFVEGDKCPSRYQSNEAYKYQKCYKLKEETPTQTNCPISRSSLETTTILTKEGLRNDNDDPIKTVFLVILALALIGVIVSILFYKRKDIERFFKGHSTDVEGGSNHDNDEDTAHTRNDEQENEEKKRTDVEGRPKVKKEYEVKGERVLENGDDEKSRLLPNENDPDQQEKRTDITGEPTVIIENEVKGEQEHKDEEKLGLIPREIGPDVKEERTDVKRGPNVETENEIKEGIKDEEDEDSSSARAGNDLEKLNSDKGVVSKTKSGDVLSSEQKSDIVTALRQEPANDTPLNTKLDKRTASLQESEKNSPSTLNSDIHSGTEAKIHDRPLSTTKQVPFSREKSDVYQASKATSDNELTGREALRPENNKQEDKDREEKKNPSTSNDGHALKPVSNENIVSKSAITEAPDSRTVSNFVSADVPASESDTTTNTDSQLNNTSKDRKSVLDDSLISKVKPPCTPDESPDPISFDKSSPLSKISSALKAPEDSVTSSDKMSKHSKTPFEISLRDSQATKPASKGDSASENAPSNDLATSYRTSSKHLSGIEPSDENTTPSVLSDDKSAPGNSASSTVTASTNPFESGLGKMKRAPEPPKHVTIINTSQNISSVKPKAQAPPIPPPRPKEQPKKS